MVIEKVKIKQLCKVCRKQLYFRHNGKSNYRYVRKMGKGYYICNTCKIKDIKEL